MAERRMFAKTIIDSDAFLDMPLSTQALYFHLSMRADDDGFLNNASRIVRLINATRNDFDLLLAKRFIIQFDEGICVIKHWRIHNYIQRDRYKETVYKDEKALLKLNENGAYSLDPFCIQDGSNMDTECIQDGSNLDPQVRLGKVSKGKIKTSCPTLAEPAPGSKPVISFLLNDGTLFDVLENDVIMYQQLYPGIDVNQELRNIVAWCDANPKNRKTRAGAKRFMNGWLSRAQNSARRQPQQSPAPKNNRFHNFDQRNTDYDALLQQMNGRE